MSNVLLLPRLSNAGVTRCMDDLERLGCDFGKLDQDRRHTEYQAWIWYAPGGGSISPELVQEIHENVTAIAKDNGYPDKASDKQKSSFDVQVAKWFAQHPHLGSAELLRDDVWSYIACILLQEFVIWRFSARQRARFAGGVRNTFQRLWMRGRTLDQGEGVGPDRWRFLESLSEDALVQVFERAAIASDARLTQALANGWVATAGRIGRGRMEDVMRRTTKLLRLRNQIIDLTSLAPEDLDSEVERAFWRSSDGFVQKEKPGEKPGDGRSLASGDSPVT
jgi:hypothetical protein